MDLFENRLKPGETVYSALVRWSLLCGYPSCRDAIKTRLNIDNKQLHSPFPTYISLLSDIVSLSPFELIEKHTILPLFRSFISKGRYKVVKNGMSNGSIASVHSKLSLIANRVRQAEGLKYCRICAHHDLSQHGHTLWHVEHQLPFLQCCVKHHERLEEIAILRRETVLPPTVMQIPDCSSTISSKDIEFNLLLSEAYRKPSAYYVGGTVKSSYLHRLKHLGLATSNNSVRMSALRSELKQYWKDVSGDNLKKCITTLFAKQQEYSFPAPLFYQNDNFHHPIKHLLLIGLLFGNWQNFRDLNKTVDLIPITPNTQKATDNELVKIEKEVAQLIKQRMSLRKVSFLTQKSVGFVKRVAKNNSLKIESRAQFLFQREQNAVIKLAKTGMSAQKIAEKICCSVGAVEQIISQTPGLVEARKTIRFENTRRNYRNRLLRAIVVMTRRTDIQREERSAYTWLFKNDRTWLYEQLPEAVSRNQRYLGKTPRSV